MNGLKYYRIKSGLSQKQLAELSGVGQMVLVKMERMGRSNVKGCLCDEFIRVSNALGIKIDELLREDMPDWENGVCLRNLRPGKSDSSDNLLTIYRRRHRMTLREVATILGVSHETVRLACISEETPEKYIHQLAVNEGISYSEFVSRYKEG